MKNPKLVKRNPKSKAPSHINCTRVPSFFFSWPLLTSIFSLKTSFIVSKVKNKYKTQFNHSLNTKSKKGEKKKSVFVHTNLYLHKFTN